jgi:hypothetical protein
MRNQKLLVIICFCLLLNSILTAAYPVLTSSQKPEGPVSVFKIEKKGLSGIVTSKDLVLTSSLKKPETLPQTDDPSKWKLLSETKTDKFLFGLNGKIDITVFLTNIGEIREENWIADDGSLVAFRQSVVNKTRKNILLNSLYPLYITGKESLRFGNVADWRILKQFRHKNDLPAVFSPGSSRNENISDVEAVKASVKSDQNCDPFLIINNDRGMGQNLFIGYQTHYLHLADISVSIDNSLNLNEISANCDFEGVEVPVNGVRTSQWIILSEGDDPHQLISDYTQRLREFHNIAKPGRDALSAYCTWYYHADNYNEKIFDADIEVFKKDHMPFDVFLIDECWDMNKWGDFEVNESFPDGMKRVAQQINSAGYIPGIWLAPFLADHESKLAKNHPEWLLKNSKGKLCTFFMNERDHLILDLTYPGVCEYLEDQFRKIAFDWGFRYFKFDFMRSVFIDTDQQFFDKTSTSLEAYRKGLEAIRRGVGDDAYISVCGGHYGASLGLADSQRSGSDVKSFWNEKELPKYRQNILRTWLADLWHVDPDAMMVRRQEKTLPNDRRNLTSGLFSNGEAFTNTLNQFIGGNLITFTEDFAIIDEDRKMLYKHVIPSVNEASRPVDIFNPAIPEIMLTSITPRCNNLEKWNMLSVVNWSNKPKEYEIDLNTELTGNLNGDQFLVFDFQKQKITGRFAKGEIIPTGPIEGHHSMLMKIVPWDGRSPIFVGTDLNFACGGLEIEEISFDNGRISGRIDTPWHIPVTLSFWIPVNGSFEMEQLEISPGQRNFYLDY